MRIGWVTVWMMIAGVLATAAGTAAVLGIDPISENLWGARSGVLTTVSAAMTTILLFIDAWARQHPIQSKRGHPAEGSFCVIVTTFLALIAFVVVMRFLPDLVSWAEWEACEDCTIQGWVSATSGWIGAGVGAIAAIAVFRQLKETKLQAAFTVGDALPTIDAIEHMKDSSELVVRIVNWNRRAMVVRDLDVTDRDVLIFPNKTAIDGETQRIEEIEFGVKPFAIKGWEDRSKPPHHAEIRLIAYLHDNLSQVQSWEDLPRIRATVQLLGNSHKLLNLTADTRPITR